MKIGIVLTKEKSINKNGAKMKRILGLDLGTSSIGWALLGLTENVVEGKNVIQDFEIIDGGVRLFKEMLNPKSGETLNSERRSSRSLRKVINRKKRRLIKVAFMLKNMGLITQNKGSLIKKDVNLILSQLQTVSSYFLRKKALDEKLSSEELVKVILHLTKRRGFRSAAKDQVKKGQELEKLRQAIQEEAAKKELSLEEYSADLVKEGKDSSILRGIVLLEMMFEDSQYRTLGEYFYKKYENTDFSQRIRGRFLDRKLLEKEFKMILEKQSEFYPILKEPKYNANYKSFWGSLRDINTNTQMLFDAIFEPRPLKGQKHLIGKCPFYPNENRAIKSSLLFQEYSLWAKINTIKIVTEKEEGNRIRKIYRDLTPQEKEIVFNLGKEKKEVTWKQVRKSLELSEEEIINFEMSKGGLQKEKFSGLISDFLLKEALQDHYNDLSYEEKEEFIQSFSDGEKAFYEKINTISKKYHFTQDTEDDLKAIDLPSAHDYASYSTKLLNIMLPYIKNGLKTDKKEVSYLEWDILKYLKEQKMIPEYKDLKNRLLNDREIDHLTTNPRVKKMLFELRKVLKSLMRKYGEKEVKENWIFKIELSREMKKSEQKKNIHTEHQTFLQQLREEARSNGMKNREDENRYILWLSQEENCAYCQNRISKSSLNGTDTEIDHIIPISRIPDDSMDNKVVCCTGCNQRKGNHTPLEAFGDTQQWTLMINKLGAITFKKTEAYKKVKNTKTPFDIPKDTRVLMNYSKFLRIQWNQEDIDAQKEKFSSRQLNETRFGSLSAIQFLEHLRGIEERSIPKDRHILTTKGGFTDRIKTILKINTKEETFTQEEIDTRIPKSLLAIKIVKEKQDDPKTKKQREDHRHHFLDAFALTFIGPSFENRVSTIEKSMEEFKQLLAQLGIQNQNNLLEKDILTKIEEKGSSEKQKDYWRRNYDKLSKLVKKNDKTLGAYYQDLIQKIAEELPKKLANIIVSHAHKRKIIGALHEESVYGVLNTIPISYLSQERMSKLIENKYISKEVEQVVYKYVENNKFLPTKEGELKRTEADNIYLYAFRRGKNKTGDKNGVLPSPIELKEYWNESIHGEYKKDKIPLLKPLYTKKAEPKKENITNVADIRFQINIAEKLKIQEQIEKEFTQIKNQDKKKNKDFTKEDIEKCPTILNEMQKIEKIDILIDKETGFYDKVIDEIRRKYQLKRVLMLNFASKKFIPHSIEDAHKAFDTGSNHHMAIFERIKKDKKGNVQYEDEGKTPKRERKGIVVTMVDAANRARRTPKPLNEKDKVIYRYYENYEKQYQVLDNPSEWKFIFSLVAGDYIELENNLLYKIYKMSGENIYCSFITTSGKDTFEYLLGKEKRKIIAAIQGRGPLFSRIVRKCYIDPLGVVVTTND